MTTPLSVLDLIPIASGSDKYTALQNSADLAKNVEQFGYQRYWFAEHHLNPGVIGVSAAVAIALIGHATSTIRLGSAGVQLGHRTPLATVEEFGLLEAAFPGRIDLGIGRSPGRPKPVPGGNEGDPPDKASSFLASRPANTHQSDEYTDNGLLLPKAFDPTTVFSSERFAHLVDLLQQPGAYVPSYREQVHQLLALLRGDYVSEHGLSAHAHPGEGAPVPVWILGSSGGDSATVAGQFGLPFVASYHHSPSTIVDAVTAYRSAFAAAHHSHEPYVAISADAVVAPTDTEAEELASGYSAWVLSIRSGDGAIAYPTPAEAAARSWTAEELDLVNDRVRTQLVGSPKTVTDRLHQLREATAADELAITTNVHEHSDRVRSYQLLAEAWFEQ